MNDSVVKLFPIVKGLSLRSYNVQLKLQDIHLPRSIFHSGLVIIILIFKSLLQITEKKRKFFEEPPPQVMHQTFTTMNLSRPLLKVNVQLLL